MRLSLVYVEKKVPILKDKEVSPEDTRTGGCKKKKNTTVLTRPYFHPSGFKMQCSFKVTCAVTVTVFPCAVRTVWHQPRKRIENTHST